MSKRLDRLRERLAARHGEVRIARERGLGGFVLCTAGSPLLDEVPDRGEIAHFFRGGVVLIAPAKVPPPRWLVDVLGGAS